MTLIPRPALVQGRGGWRNRFWTWALTSTGGWSGSIRASGAVPSPLLGGAPLPRQEHPRGSSCSAGAKAVSTLTRAFRFPPASAHLAGDAYLLSAELAVSVHGPSLHQREVFLRWSALENPNWPVSSLPQQNSETCPSSSLSSLSEWSGPHWPGVNSQLAQHELEGKNTIKHLFMAWGFSFSWS